jgi:hypothetical protein
MLQLFRVFHDTDVAIHPPKQKTFDLEGEILEHALTKCPRIRNDDLESSRPRGGRHPELSHVRSLPSNHR